MDIKILVVDDDEVYRNLISDILKKQGYMVIEAGEGQEALDLFYENPGIDLIILDGMMPKADGWHVTSEIRKDSEVPIICLTALGDPQSEINGLRVGADDYISKPFHYEVFLARIDTLLRKKKKVMESKSIYGNLIVDQIQHTVMVNEEEVILSRKEYELLLYLLENAGAVLTRDQMINKIWGYDFEGDVRTVDTHIKTLRAKLLECGSFIQTVRGYGYRFEVDEL